MASTFGFEDFSFGDERAGSYEKRNRVKFKQNDKKRFSLAWWPNGDLTQENPSVRRYARHYLAGVGYFLSRGPEFAKEFGDPQERWTTVVVEWPLQPDGKIDTAAIQQGKFKVAYWTFGKQIFQQIKMIGQESPLNGLDLVCTCTDEKFQKIQMINNSNGNSYVKLSEKFGLKAAVQDYIDHLGEEVARDLTLEQVREAIAKAAGGSPGGFAPNTRAQNPAGAPAELDMDDLLAE